MTGLAFIINVLQALFFEADKKGVWCMKKNRVLLFAAGAFMLLAVLGPLFTFPKLEEKLNQMAMEQSAIKQLQLAELKWNGRNAYLYVPKDVDPKAVEQAASVVAQLRGVRSTKIIYTDKTAVEERVSEWTVMWTDGEKTMSGAMPKDCAERIRAQLNLEGLITDEGVLMPDKVMDVLAQIDQSVFDDLKQGCLSVEGDMVVLSGKAEDLQQLESLKKKWGHVEGLTLQIDEPDKQPADFSVSWDTQSVNQMGAAPLALANTLTAMGISEPMLEQSLTVSKAIEQAMQAAVPYIGNELLKGTVRVENGESLTIDAVALDGQAFERVVDSLADMEAVTLNVERSAAAVAQEIDALLIEQRIEFESGSDSLTDASSLAIKQLAEVLKANPNTVLAIVGHTDAQGAADENLALSKSRAQAVLEALVAEQIDRTRLTAEGKGATEPIDTNETAEGRQKNRRVEISVKEKK